MSGYRSPLHFANTVDYDAMKRHAFHDQNIVISSVCDSRLTWLEQEFLRQIGEKLYGKKPKPAGS